MVNDAAQQRQRVLVTGASGFIGHALCNELSRRGLLVRASVRKPTDTVAVAEETIVTGEMTPLTEWSAALAGVDAVIHLAARTHVMDETATDALSVYRRVNTDATLNLARQASAAGIPRFVFMSSIKVNGEASPANRPFKETDAPTPLDPYGLSKHEAEQALVQIGQESNLQIAIIRPPLVYGHAAKGNLATLASALQRCRVLPLGAIHNRRSMIALDNLVDFTILCATHPAAANQTFLVSDTHDVSTTELVRGIAKAAGQEARLLPVPAWLLQAAGTTLGKRAAVQRLCGSLCVDTTKARQLLGWTPLISMEEGLRRMMAESTTA